MKVRMIIDVEIDPAKWAIYDDREFQPSHLGVTLAEVVEISNAGQSGSARVLDYHGYILPKGDVRPSQTYAYKRRKSGKRT